MPVDLVSQLIGASIRALGLGVIAFVGLLVFRIRSSAARHAAWTVVLVGMLLQIPLAVVAPRVVLRLPALSTPYRPQARESAKVPVPVAQGALARAAYSYSQPHGKWASPSEMLTGVDLAISILLLLRMAFGSWGLHRILRNAKPIPNLGPGIFESASFVGPGSTRTRVFLPQAWRDWDALKLRAVLAHENAHICRLDWLVRVASHVNVCIFWFHPFAWWMERELDRLAEDACDDVALSKIDDREEYAATLVEIALVTAADGGVLNWRVISMAKESNVIRRVNRILNRRFQVSKPIGHFAWATLLAFSLPAIYLSAAVKLASANRNLAVVEHSTRPGRPIEAARPATSPEQKSATKILAQAVASQPPRPLPVQAPSASDAPPVTMCVLIDSSGSMREKRAEVRAAALAVARATRPHDEVCIVDFNDEASNDLPNGGGFTSDIQEMEAVIAHIESRGGSAMRDAIGMSIDYLGQRAHNDNRALILVTDGDDNASVTSQEQLLAKVGNSGVRVYCIGLLSEDHPRQTEANRRAMERLAEASGGRSYYPKGLAELESISNEIANQVRKR
jgi:Mg-chelatase subunit ChlD